MGLPGSDDGRGPNITPRCSAVFDLRISYADDLEGVPFFERKGLELERNESATVDATAPIPRDPSVPLLYEVTVKGEHIDGRHCVFRGAVEVRSTYEGRTSRLLPLRPEDFILLREPVGSSSRLPDH